MSPFREQELARREQASKDLQRRMDAALAAEQASREQVAQAIASAHETLDEWAGVPRHPEARFLTATLESMAVSAAHSDLAIAASHHAVLVMEQMMQDCRETMERSIVESRNISEAEMRSVQQALNAGVLAVRDLKAINEDTVRSKLIDIISHIRADVSSVMRSKIRAETFNEVSKVTGGVALALGTVGSLLFGLGHVLR